jgi:hypothetical protein
MFGKVIRPYGSLYILLYFHNECKMMEAIYKSMMERRYRVRLANEKSTGTIQKEGEIYLKATERKEKSSFQVDKYLIFAKVE